MRLYVWEGVLSDYTDGLVCVLAKSEKQAWQKLYEKDDTAWWSLQGHPTFDENKDKSHSEYAQYNVPKCGYFSTAIRPKLIKEPEAFIVWGGG